MTLDWIEINPESSARLVFLYDETFNAVEDRQLRIFPAFPTDMTQVYDTYDSEDTPDMERPACNDESGTNRKIYPTCNEFHTLDLQEIILFDQASILSNKGYWRTAWEYHESRNPSIITNATATTLVLKTLRPEHTYEDAFFDYQRVDAIVMEKFASSPYIIDMYSYCGMSVLTDFAETNVSRVVDKLNATKRPVVETLKLAKQVAKGVWDLHRGGVVHNDVNQANLAYSLRKQGPVFFDFNIAVVNNKNSSCPFVSKFPNPQWRAPEEQELGNLLTEKVDTYALGNIFFRMVVGRPPWGKGSLTREQKQFIADSKSNGTMPPYNVERLETKNDTATTALIHIMEKCYALEPRQRPSASRIVAMLNAAIQAETNRTGHHQHRHERNRTTHHRRPNVSYSS